MDPAEEDVARRLHQALPEHDPLAVIRVLALAEIGLEDRGSCLLDLEEERIARIPPDEEHDPAARPDAADADDLAGDVDPVELLEDVAPVGEQRPPVLAEEVVELVGHAVCLEARLGGELLDRDDQRRVGDDPPLAVDLGGEPGERLQAVLRPCLGRRLGDALHLRLVLLAPEPCLDSFDVGFKLAPRLNACGRMGHARQAVELLTTTDEARAAEIATWLETQNRQRQAMERKIVDQATAKAIAEKMDADNSCAIVLSDPD